MVMALCLGSSEQIRSSKERGFDPRPPHCSFAMCVYIRCFLSNSRIYGLSYGVTLPSGFRSGSSN